MFRGLGIGVAVCLAATAAAQDPSYVWQGRLLDAGGTPVHGQQDLTFTLTDDASQTLWAKTYEDVVVSDGFVGVVLSGDDDQVPAQGLAPHWFLADVDLTIAVGGTLLQTLRRVVRARRQTTLSERFGMSRVPCTYVTVPSGFRLARQGRQQTARHRPMRCRAARRMRHFKGTPPTKPGG
jgi:hypothetical protein